jgi:hypothetical protein
VNLGWFLPRNHAQKYGDNGNRQEDVNESTQGDRYSDADHPQDCGNNCNCIKHASLSKCFLNIDYYRWANEVLYVCVHTGTFFFDSLNIASPHHCA